MINFDQFWQQVRDQHRSEWERGLIDWEIIPRGDIVKQHHKSWRIDWIRFSSSDEGLINGWVGRPEDHDSNEIGMLWLPGYSYGTPPPDETNLIPGITTLCINLHGNLPDSPYVNPAGKNDYITEDIDDPSCYILRRSILHCLHAMSIVGKLDGVDADKTVVAGMSQGGALSLLTAVNHEAPKVCFADMPFLCSIRQAMTVSHSPAYKEVARYMETHPERAEHILDTLSLFDPLYHAPRLKIPTSITAGGKDPASRAVTIKPVFEALEGISAQYRLFPDAGHVFLPEMVQIIADWTDRFVLGLSHFIDV